MGFQGGLRGDDQEKTLLAFVMIALAEAKLAGINCTDPNIDVNVRRSPSFAPHRSHLGRPVRRLTASRGVCLLQALHARLTQSLKRALVVPRRRPYTVAILSYALALNDKGYNPMGNLMRAAAPSICNTHNSCSLLCHFSYK